MPYTHTTLNEAIAALSIRLVDPEFRYWSGDEMGRRIVQAMRMFQSLTSFYTLRTSFVLNAGDSIVDLHGVIAPLFGFTITDQDTIRQIQYALLEPPTGSSWMGSEQFSFAMVVNALQRRRNQFLYDTGIVLLHSRQDVPPQPIGRVPLPEEITAVKRLAWVDIDGLITPLFRDDEFSAQAYNPGWPQEPGLPLVYSAAITPPVSVQLVPPPLDKGALDMITIPAAPDLDPTNGPGFPMSVPDDLCWAVEFGALADLLSVDGLTHDPGRAAYCEGIYRMGVELAKSNASVLAVQINDEPVFTGSIYEIDTFSPDWQNVRDKPEFTGLAGRNILAFSPTPDIDYGVSLDLLPNLPVPHTGEDVLQIGLEHLEGVLDMAQHLCAFKQGGGEFNETQPLFKNFLSLAHRQNDKLAAMVFYKDAMYALPQLQEKEVPVLAPPAAPGSPSGGA